MIKKHTTLFNKIVVFGIVLVLLSCTLSAISFARTGEALAEGESLPIITIQSRTGADSVHRGQPFTIDIVLSNNTKGLTGLFLTLLPYDTTAFKLVNVVQGPALNLKFDTTNTDTEEGYSIIDPVTGGFNLMWEGDNDKSEGVIATLTFNSLITAELGDYPINFKYDKNNTTIDYQVHTDLKINNSIVTLITSEFEAVYKNYDGTILYSKDCLPDDIPVYPYENPTREPDAEYTYEFSEWESVLSDDPKILIYRAKYKSTAQEYNIFYYVDGEYYTATKCKFNELVDTSIRPSKKDCTFFGWYIDEGCTASLTSPYMPACDLKLYGYFKYNIREDDIPTITFYHRETIDNVAYVDVYVLKNSGVNGMVLTPSYDRNALTLIGYEKGEDCILGDMQFSHSKVEKTEDYAIEDFNFFWESSTNNYEIGKFLTLKFRVAEGAADGNYFVTFIYEEGKDATYIEANKDIWYTELEIISGNVPIGLRYHWNECVNQEDDVDIDVLTEVGKSYNVELVVKDITKESKKELNEDYVASVIGTNRKMLFVYSTDLYLNGNKVDSCQNTVVRIKLTQDQKDYPKLYLYSLDNDGKLNYHESIVENGYLTFTTDALSNWTIVCDKGVVDGKIGPDTFTLILLPSLLAVTTMAVFLIYLGKRRKSASQE